MAALAAAALVAGVAGAPGGGVAAPVSARIPAAVLAALLLVLTPSLWRGTRTAVGLAIPALLALAALAATHGQPAMAGAPAAGALLLTLARAAFPLGCTHRPRPVIVGAAAVAWGLAAAALAESPVVRHHAAHVLSHVLRHPVAHALRLAIGPAIAVHWGVLVDVLIGGAAAVSALALRSLLAPAAPRNFHSETADRAARAIVATHGGDSLSPFLVRPDKALMFGAGGVLAYRVIGGTAVVSADPVGPPECAGPLVAEFRRHARRQGWEVVLWGTSERHLDDYRRLGLRALCVGEEAFVDPARFTLEGRSVRKLRQSVHRVARRGWEIDAQEGREIDRRLEAEIDELAARWRRAHPHVHGFAMSMGSYDGELRPDDLYVVARSPQGELAAAMRFVACRDCLSLDTMHRIGDTPNGLNEALVVRALQVARERGFAEVSLNYAGLAHLIRREPSANPAVRRLAALALAPLHRRFQMDRLVRFNEKFSPQWRPRYLVYESRTALPRAILRVLQAEGYVREGRRRTPGWTRRPLAPLPARLRARRPLGESR